MNAAPARPPYRQLATTLRTTTERLARELANAPLSRPARDLTNAPLSRPARDLTNAPLSRPAIEGLFNPPDWTPFDWSVARASSAMHGISALLANGLPWRGPPGWQHFLSEQARHTLLRDVRIGELLAEIDVLARREAVGVVMLKGAALRTMNLYAQGERPMGDIDLYAPTDTFPKVARVLAALGYSEAFRVPRHIAYRAGPANPPQGAGEHIGNSIKIELHGLVAESLPADTVDITSRLAPSPLQPGVHGYRSRAALMAHLLMHAAGNMRAHALRLVQLHDIARLSTLMNGDDWHELTWAGNEIPWWAYPPLLLATKYCVAAVPRELLALLEHSCPLMLARAARRWTLTDVSWSNLRIPAFPGIEWSRSANEAARFAMSRLFPSRSALEGLSVAMHEQPQMTAIPWYTRSHPARIVRWVFGRPPRVQTMSSVMAALGER